jgi:putative membrane protein
LSLAGAALAQPAAPTPALPTPDFVKAAAQTDAFEIQEGSLAAKQGSTARVRDFGSMMVTDHTKTTAGLKAALHTARLPPPAPPQLSDDQKANLATLQGLHGTAFDKAYIAEQISAHQTALGVMTAYAASGDNAELRKAAGETVPVVKHHLEVAQQIQAGT